MILACCDDSSIIFACHQGALILILLEEDEKSDMPSYLSTLWLNFVTVHQRMCRPILGGCFGMAVALLSSLHIVEEH
jgi:hypothetical protein